MGVGVGCAVVGGQEGGVDGDGGGGGRRVREVEGCG